MLTNLSRGLTCPMKLCPGKVTCPKPSDGAALACASLLNLTIFRSYFLAWVISFIPQLYINYTSKSVIGLSFDFVFLNIFGYLCYSVNLLAFSPWLCERGIMSPKDCASVHVEVCFRLCQSSWLTFLCSIMTSLSLYLGSFAVWLLRSNAAFTSEETKLSPCGPKLL